MGSRPQAQKLKRHASRLDGLAEVVGRFIPAEVFEPHLKTRRRVFTARITFIAFLGQALQRDSTCREAVRRVQSWAAAEGRPVPDESTSGYCQARQRLAQGDLEAAHAELGNWFGRQHHELWHGREVKVVDGTGITMPDTAANRAVWSYANNQQPGCGFPAAKLVGLFSLATGRLESFTTANRKQQDISMARDLVDGIEPGTVILADRGFAGWGFMTLLQQRGVDLVMRMHKNQTVTGPLMQLKKPRHRSSWPREQWDKLPAELGVRVVRCNVQIGARAKEEVVLITTLLDAQKYPDAAIAELYLRRWSVELCFRDIKTTLGLDVLRCTTPALINKEIWMQVLAYNLVRALMLEASRKYSVPLERLSFTGTIVTLRSWRPLRAPILFAEPANYQELLRIIAADALPHRPNRHEPRVKKRREKPCHLMCKPRHVLRAALLAPKTNESSP